MRDQNPRKGMYKHRDIGSNTVKINLSENTLKTIKSR